MENNELVSVIVLTYKNYEGVEETIKSIVKQDYREIELIIADDGSPNYDYIFFEKIIGSHKQRFTNLLIYTNKLNVGTVKNYNLAIEKSHGSVIMPLASDDIFYDNRVISKVVDFMKRNNFSICTAYREGIESGKISPKPEDVEIINTENRELILERLFVDALFCGANLYLTRNIYNELNGFDEKYYIVEDYPFSIKCYIKGYKIGFLDYTTIYYGEHGVSNPEDWKVSVNLMLEKDKLLVMNNEIIPNLDQIKNKKIKRYVKCRSIYKGEKNKIFKTIKMLMYIDMILIILIQKHINYSIWSILKR